MPEKQNALRDEPILTSESWHASSEKTVFELLEAAASGLSRLNSLRLYLDYQIRDNATVRAGYWYEQYSSSDWALDNVFPATVPQLLSLQYTW